MKISNLTNQKIPRLRLIPKDYAGQAKRAEVMKKIIEYQFGDAREQKRRRNLIKLMEYEHEKNPLGLITVYWDEAKGVSSTDSNNQTNVTSKLASHQEK